MIILVTLNHDLQNDEMINLDNFSQLHKVKIVIPGLIIQD